MPVSFLSIRFILFFASFQTLSCSLDLKRFSPTQTIPRHFSLTQRHVLIGPLSLAICSSTILSQFKNRDNNNNRERTWWQSNHITTTIIVNDRAKKVKEKRELPSRSSSRGFLRYKVDEG